MELKRSTHSAIIISVISPSDWEDLFERGEENEFTFDVNESNLEIFCPGWRDYIDQGKPFETLKIEEACHVERIFLAYGPDVEDEEGEGIYKVNECIFDLANKDQSGEDKLPSYEDFLSNVGTVTYKIEPFYLLGLSDDELDDIFNE